MPRKTYHTPLSLLLARAIVAGYPLHEILKMRARETARLVAKDLALVRDSAGQYQPTEASRTIARRIIAGQTADGPPPADVRAKRELDWGAIMLARMAVAS
jgi:hypothetical protein